ncbi:DDE-type integrase/transposase/recombinase [Mycetohabitans sp. B5]|uniref:Integrase-like protein n=1 Tax=Mycetohabitans endofungorum TaxID=417203 RepID=A0A2P5KD35_9BURK|nr:MULTISPECIES: DDE-type integrase/transposase/recombinase [Mycetohabitans]MCG1053459.1 DDE-type integrase/transposase/recombinase [Mycetohabitans sp. B5]PPB84621.1 integrase-like protein [Mycetohabitans endofungorum]
MQHKVWPYLLWSVKIERANQLWALDTTYVPMVRGFVYLTAVVDWVSRKVLAHRVAITLEATHAVEALEEAFARYGSPKPRAQTKAISSQRTRSLRPCRAEPEHSSVNNGQKKLARQCIC